MMRDTPSMTNEVGQITATMWESVLSLPLEPSGDARILDAGEGRWTSCLGFMGPWSGALTVVCSDVTARRATGAMFELEPADVGPGEIGDALGEVVNIVGGHIKTLIGEPCALGLPTVVEGHAYHLIMPDTHPIVHLLFACEGEPVEVTLLRGGAGCSDPPSKG
jgi:chemotaxis protein CheX